jgi:hypothetical protein
MKQSFNVWLKLPNIFQKIKAWVGLRLRLGEEPGPSQNTYNLPKTTNSPSRDRRRIIRAAERVKGNIVEETNERNEHDAEESIDNNVGNDKDAEEVLVTEVEHSEVSVVAENVEKELVCEEIKEKNDVALPTSEDVSGNEIGKSSVEVTV